MLASHPYETIHIVFSLWDITLQPPVDHQLHICFPGKACICKVGMMRSATGATGATGARGAAGGTAGYIMYMYEHRYRFFLLSFSRVRITYG